MKIKMAYYRKGITREEVERAIIESKFDEDEIYKTKIANCSFFSHFTRVFSRNSTLKEKL